ncbi:MAG: class I SAM-dependent methyltransferase [Anaerolineae bacterium]
MRKDIVALMRELERRDREERAEGMPRELRARNLKPDTGRLLNLLIRAARSRRIVEVGTSNGYSTLWLAEAAGAVKGHVTTIELRPARHAEALDNFARVGLAEVVDARLGNAHAILPTLPSGFDMAFIDAEKYDYAPLAEGLLSKVAPGGLLVADNITSHAETAAYVEFMNAQPTWVTSIIPIGEGIAVSVKLAKPPSDAFRRAVADQEERARVQKAGESVTRDTGALLFILVSAMRARRVLEVGGGAGYATLWLGEAARLGKAQVVSIERDTAQVNIARRNLNAASLVSCVDVRIGDAARLLPRVEETYDLVLFDDDREHRLDFLKGLLPRIRIGGLALSHAGLSYPAELSTYTAFVRSAPGLDSVLAPVGSGLEMTLKEAEVAIF